MALQTKTIQGSASNNWIFETVVTENSISIANNTSSVTVEHFLSHHWAGSYLAGTCTITWACNGETREETKYINSGSLSSYQKYSLGSETFTVEHNNDGKKTIDVSGTLSTTAFNPNSASSSGSMELTKIPRASTISGSSAYIGETSIIVITQQLDVAYHDVTYEIGTGSSKLSGTIATKTQNTNLALDTSSLKAKIYQLIPNDTQIKCTIYCKTYTKSETTGAYTQMGDTQKGEFYLYAKESDCKPTITSSVVETNSKITTLLGANNIFVKGLSLPKITISATPNLSSTIKSYTYDLNNGATYTSTTAKTYTFEQYLTSKVITTKVVDSRNYTNQYDIDVSQTPYKFVDYTSLVLNAIRLQRTEDVSNEVVLTCNGTWFNGNFSTTVANTLTAKFQYKKSNETVWSVAKTITPTIDSNTFKFSNYSLGNIYDFDTEYQFKIIISDKLNSVEDTETVSKGQEVVAIGDDKGWLYGTWKLNDNIIGTAKNQYNTSKNDSYSCDYINNNVDFCSMCTNFSDREYTDTTTVVGWTSPISVGDYIADTTNNCLIIKNTSILQLGGLLSGSGYAWGRFIVIDTSTNEELAINYYNGVLYQFGGNGFWSAPLAPLITQLDKTKEYKVQLRISAYNSTFSMNSGFSESGTYMWAKKIK